MIPKDKAKEIMKMFADKPVALKAVGLLIKEHTWVYPISWNVNRKQYWENVHEEIIKL